MAESAGSSVRNVPFPTILLIDDDRAVLHSLAAVLEAEGFNVLTADDGLAGMRVLHQSRPDIVVTDIIMPNQEGIETIVQMRRARPDIKIIAMSGGGRIGNMDFLSIAHGLGADATLAKPFDPDELTAAVHDLLAREAPTSAPPAAA
jgi:two-component system, chemotaxis family, chemotaxis protein CheY